MIESKIIIFASIWDVSSVGSERLLDRQEVTGSIPVRPTIPQRIFKRRMFYSAPPQSGASLNITYGI